MIEINGRLFVKRITRDFLLCRWRTEVLPDGGLRPISEIDEPDLFPKEILGRKALGE